MYQVQEIKGALRQELQCFECKRSFDKLSNEKKAITNYYEIKVSGEAIYKIHVRFETRDSGLIVCSSCLRRFLRHIIIVARPASTVSCVKANGNLTIIS